MYDLAHVSLARNSGVEPIAKNTRPPSPQLCMVTGTDMTDLMPNPRGLVSHRNREHQRLVKLDLVLLLKEPRPDRYGFIASEREVALRLRPSTSMTGSVMKDGLRLLYTLRHKHLA